jgi:hypothetical protein
MGRELAEQHRVELKAIFSWICLYYVSVLVFLFVSWIQVVRGDL